MKEEIVQKSMEKLRLKPNLDYDKVVKSFKWDDIKSEIEFFEKGKLNAAYNAVDRHVKTWRKNKVALYWESDNDSKKFTFSELSILSNKFANVLKNLGVKKEDRVFILLPRIPSLYISFLGILKVGAIAGTMFSAFGPSGIKDRLADSTAKVLITDPELKKRVDEIRFELPSLETIIVVGDNVPKEKGVVSYNEEMNKASRNFDIEKTDPEDFSFMLYTSGTTGKSKGIVHAHYSILQQHITAKWVLDLHEEDVMWCTADPGWVTGIAYGILGSWSNGASLVVYEGRFDPAKWYSILEKYNVSIWYSAPTAIRMLMAAGNDILKKYDLSSLRYLCSVGEPLNPEAVKWSVEELGLPFHDNYWQTETGSIMVANYPLMPIKPGSMGKPIPGVRVAIVDDAGKELPIGKEGNLVIQPGWPSMMRQIWQNKEKYDSYFKGKWYFTGDRSSMDKDGYVWFVGRADDVIKTAGERVGPFEVESVLIEHPAVAEAGVIGVPDELRGEVIKAFLVLKPGNEPSEGLKEDIKKFVKTRLAGHAYPKDIDFIKTLPKTRSGKIMRRVLKARELGLPEGDLTTLEE
ncbi:MAG: acetate--CoA ligase [Candidatus Aenigmarchaeota archaeon]|nr:acetate--CoA ligase [Candidatus Aenigmarchaeota archaeon]